MVPQPKWSDVYKGQEKEAKKHNQVVTCQDAINDGHLEMWRQQQNKQKIGEQISEGERKKKKNY